MLYPVMGMILNRFYYGYYKICFDILKIFLTWCIVIEVHTDFLMDDDDLSPFFFFFPKYADLNKNYFKQLSLLTLR